MSLKLKTAGMVVGILIAQIAVFADQASDVMLSTKLTDQQKQAQISKKIKTISASDGDVTAFAVNVIAHAPETSKDLTISVVAVAASEITNAPLVVASIISSLDAVDGAKVFAAALLASFNTGLDLQVLVVAIQEAEINSAAMDALYWAAADPVAFMSEQTVLTALNVVKSITIASAPTPLSINDVVNPDVFGTRILTNALEVPGYGFSTN